MRLLNRQDNGEGVFPATSAHNVPVLPGGHIHLKDPIPSTHVLPNVHGSDMHSFMSIKRSENSSYHGMCFLEALQE